MKPVDREELYLSAIAGETTNELPDPVTRKEIYWANILERVSGIQSEIDILESVKRYIGVTTTEILDGSAVNPITINGESVTAMQGDATTYNGVDYIFNGEIWQESFVEMKELTQAEYDALSQSEKLNGTVYFITDAVSGYAVDSALSATSENPVQNKVIKGALDEKADASDLVGLATEQYVDDAIAAITDYESEAFPNG